ncbi:MAG: hypothetical protein MI746_03920 [Pseudomonadales bacterium]|nr:hypothetical protein [Pseudomonadales bacterium]
MIRVVINVLCWSLLFALMPSAMASDPATNELASLAVEAVPERFVLNQFCLNSSCQQLSATGESDQDALADYEAKVLASQQLKQHLEDLRSIEGSYGNSLIEAHRQYGQLLLELELHEAAALEFEQAWHISRVNHGLYSEEQLPHLNHMIEAYAELKRWEEVHDLHQLGFLVGSRIYPPDDLRYVLAAELYTAWQWEALTQNKLAANSLGVIQSARELSVLYETILDRIDEAARGPSLSSLNLILGKARTDLAIAQSVVRLRHYGGQFADPQCRNDGYHQRRRNVGCRPPTLVSFGPADFMQSPGTYSLAGLYIRQVDDAILRLEEILRLETEIEKGERAWIETLVTMLRAESDSLLRSSRPR